MNIGSVDIEAAFVLWTLANGVCVLGLAMAANSALRRRSGALRASLWNMTFIALLAAPVLRAVGPQWRASPIERIVDFSLVAERAPSVASTLIAEAPKSATPASTERFESGRVEQTPVFTKKTLGALIVAIWLIGAVALLIRLVAAHWRVRVRYTRATRAVPDAIRDRMEVLKRRHGLCRSIRIAMIEAGASPMTLFSPQPTIYLPDNVEELSDLEIDVILQHELAHIIRRDPFWAFVGQLVASLYWPIPLWRSALRAQRHEQEVACDNFALNNGVAPCDYADTLLNLRRVFALESPDDRCALSMNSRNGLSQRVETALSNGADRRPVSRSQQCVVAAVAFAFAMILGGVRTGAPQETDRGQSEADDWGGWIRLSRNPLSDNTDPDLRLRRIASGDGTWQLRHPLTGEIVATGIRIYPEIRVNPWGFIDSDDTDPFIPEEFGEATEVWSQRVREYFGNDLDSEQVGYDFNPSRGQLMIFGPEAFRDRAILRLADSKFKPSTFQMAVEIRKFDRSAIDRILGLFREIQPIEFSGWNGREPIGVRAPPERQAEWGDALPRLGDSDSDVLVQKATVAVAANTSASIGKSSIPVSADTDPELFTFSVYSRYNYQTGQLSLDVTFFTITTQAFARGLAATQLEDSWVLILPPPERGSRPGWALRVELMEVVDDHEHGVRLKPMPDADSRIQMDVIEDVDAEVELRKELSDNKFDMLTPEERIRLIIEKIQEMQRRGYRDRLP